MDLNYIKRKVKQLLEKEHRKDAPYRHIILVDQIGDLGKYITHDPKENPHARAHGNKEEEAINFGEAFVHLYMLGIIRDVNIEEGIEKAIKKIETEWEKKKGIEGKVIGRTDWNGTIESISYVVSKEHPLEEFDRGILVIKHARPDIVNYLATAYVTDEGGLMCHAAVVGREKNIPFIVGTGNATKLIKHGQKIKMKGDGKKGEVYV